MTDIYAEIKFERDRQDVKWGGADHDDKLSIADWYEIISDYNGWGRRMLCMGSLEKARKRFIQIAAVAVAIVERIDRKKEKRG